MIRTKASGIDSNTVSIGVVSQVCHAYNNMMKSSIERHRRAPRAAGSEADCGQVAGPDRELEPAELLELLGLLRLLGDHAHPETSAPDKAEELRSEVTLGRYRVLDTLGEGTFGIVLKAFDPHLDRVVALKIPRPQALLAGHSPSGFLREARLGARFQHPSIVPVHEVGQIGPIWYIAAAFQDGPTLSDWLSVSGSIAPKIAARLIAQLAEALDYAHKRGVIHRDLKPSNVLVVLPPDREELPRLLLTDFGLASHVADDQEELSRIRGTLRYMAPEALSPERSGPGVASDIFSLGTILYELLCGALPVEVSHRSGTSAINGRYPLPPLPPLRATCPQVARDLAAICDKCLRPSPADRYDSALELARDLQRFCRDDPVVARPLGTVGQLWRATQRRPALATLLIGVLASWFAGTVLVATLYERERAQRRIADDLRRTAHRVIDDTLTQFTENELVNVPGMDPVTMAFLEKALRYYEVAARADSRDERSLYELQAALHRYANICDWIGRNSESIARRTQCLGTIDQLISRAPHNPQYQFAKFHNLMLLGEKTNQLRTLSEAHRVILDLAISHPDQQAYQEALVSSGIALARGHRRHHHADTAESLLCGALKNAEKLRRRFGASQLCLKGVADAERALLEVFGSQGRTEEALQCVARLKRLDQERSAANPSDRHQILEQSSHERSMADFFQACGRFAEAEACFLSAARGFERIAREFPQSPGGVGNLAATLCALGGMYRDQGASTKAQQQFKSAALEVQATMRDFPNSGELKQLLALALSEGAPHDFPANPNVQHPLEN